MALWGNNDNVDSTGIVTCNYSTLEVIGSGTSFGNAGSAKTGDIIRFGFRQATGAAAAAGVATYFGDAVIVGIASTTSLTIGSTAGLSGVAIAATAFTISSVLFIQLETHITERVTVTLTVLFMVLATLVLQLRLALSMKLV